MLSSVNLDDQALVATNEVNSEAPNWSLPTKTQSIEPVRAQCRPQPMFGIGHIGPQRLRTLSLKNRHSPMCGRRPPLPAALGPRPPPQVGTCTAAGAAPELK